jgi:hypothetical protein
MYKAKVFLMEWKFDSSTNGGMPELSLQIVQKDIVFYEPPTRESVAAVIDLFPPPHVMYDGTLRALPHDASLNFTSFTVSDDDV